MVTYIIWHPLVHAVSVRSDPGQLKLEHFILHLVVDLPSKFKF